MFKRHRLQRQMSQLGVLSFISFLVALAITLYFYNSSSSPSTPEEGEVLSPLQLVEQFYQYEQAGDFGSSWELFHPQMKEKFEKQNYIQQRSHVFMQHFDVMTFEYQLGDPVTVIEWKMSPSAPTLPEVTKIPVTVSYFSAFGDFAIQQDVFVALDQEQSLILWSYSEASD